MEAAGDFTRYLESSGSSSHLVNCGCGSIRSLGDNYGEPGADSGCGSDPPIHRGFALATGRTTRACLCVRRAVAAGFSLDFLRELLWCAGGNAVWRTTGRNSYMA